MPGWLPTRNRLRRLVTTPTHHPALAARLLRVDAPTLLPRGGGEAVPRDGVLLGALFESLVALSVRVYAQSREARVSHLRTEGGEREADLVVEGEGGRASWPSRSSSAGPVIVSTGPEACRRPDGIAVVPLALLGP